MSALYKELQWLPRAPADFRQRCRELAAAPEPSVRALRNLAGRALDEIQLRRLADVVELLRGQGRSLAPLTPFTLGIVGNATLEPLVPALVATAVRHGIALSCVRADYAQTVQEALSPESAINAAKPHAVLLAIDYRGLPLREGPWEAQAAQRAVGEARAYLDVLRTGFRTHAGALSIVQTLAAPPEAVFGNYDRALPGTMRSSLARFNEDLVASLSGTNDVVLDVAALAETVGLAEWFAPTQWNIAKLPFHAAYLPLYADHVCRVIAALRGKSRRCLVLDLDNTLWGGVIGDDGLEGIVLGQGNATGEAYTDVQRTALLLRERGIVLAVSSKNDDEVARAVFSEHPEMLLRERHIAVFQANWNDKATNIESIAKELALGLDAMVFLDDNPVERGLVREMLPEVAVPELPSDPALYARTLLAAGYFEAITFSDEDAKRAEFYQDNARRVALASQVADVDSYLASLEMCIIFRPFDSTGRSRISQLINKSNQFNLTTRRYSEADVAAVEADPAAFSLQARLTDAFGDNGMISVVICRQRDRTTWEIDTWLMSCRVLGRGVEQMVLREIIHHARVAGITNLIGSYIPTERNGMVRDHYRKLGFAQVSEEASGTTFWRLSTATEVEPSRMTVDRSGFDLTLA